MTWATVGAASRAKNTTSGNPSLLIDVGTSATTQFFRDKADDRLLKLRFQPDGWRDAAGAAETQDGVAQGRRHVWRRGDQGLARQLFGTDARQRCEGMAGRHGEAKLFFKNLMRRKPSYGAGIERHSGIEAARQNGIRQQIGNHFAQLDTHVRVLGHELPREARQHRMRGVHHEADRQRAKLPALRQIRVAARLIEGGDRQTGILEEALTGVSEFGAARISLQKADAELPLQRGDLPCERRLADVQALGGATEMQRFGQRHEVAHLAEVNHSDTEKVLMAS